MAAGLTTRSKSAVRRPARPFGATRPIGAARLSDLEDATPLTVGQEWSGYAGALDDAIAELEHATNGLLKDLPPARVSQPILHKMRRTPASLGLGELGGR
jgi:hypothetical protein